eukprot:TRINITY_DN12036_c0_g1_i1.p1 TRINITY_DN12036_c0_g1~~TRINITY_DN12036_c0_g1_i1.p1  ORF type:complete len:322 (-),score=52.60 TRINITY_DN12036_c0_g1_i1:89-1054(-)
MLFSGLGRPIFQSDQQQNDPHRMGKRAQFRFHNSLKKRSVESQNPTSFNTYCNSLPDMSSLMNSSFVFERNNHSSSSSEVYRPRRSQSCSNLGPTSSLLPRRSALKKTKSTSHADTESSTFDSYINEVLKDRSTSANKKVRFAEDLKEETPPNKVHKSEVLVSKMEELMPEPEPRIEIFPPENTVQVDILGIRGLLFQYMVYNISIALHSENSTAPVCFVAERRYSDFVWLWEYLKKKFPTRDIPSIPGKRGVFHYGDRFDADFLEQRRAGLQEFLQHLLSMEDYAKESAVMIFLQAETKEAFQSSKMMLIQTMRVEKTHT